MKQSTKSNGSTTAADKKAASSKTSTAQTKAKGVQQGKEEDEKQESLLEKFFLDQLKDIYYAEQQILKALPKMEEACTTEELKEAFSDHRHQTEKHVKRLEKAFEAMEEKAQGKKCEAIEGIIKECESIIKETQAGSMTRDAALIMAAQKVEHYEIATYGGLVQLAITIGQHKVSEILDKTLMEEENTDKLLTDIAEGYINIEAEEEDKYSSKRKVREAAMAMG